MAKDSNRSRQIMPKARSEKILVQVSGNETLIYDQETDKAHCLNPAAGLVWKRCDGETPFAEASQQLESDLGIKSSDQVTRLALQELSENNLLEGAWMPQASGPQVSRRDLMVRFGIPMAALPVVMSMAAPSPAEAQTTCIEPGQPCLPGQIPCCPGFICSADPEGGQEGPGGICVPDIPV